MGRGSVVKNIPNSKLKGRRMGRLRIRRLEDAENNLREMKVKSWPHKAVDREKWMSVSKEAKVLRRPYGQGVSNVHAVT
jgi:hypothetical protein